MWFIFGFGPYFMAEGLGLSGGCGQPLTSSVQRTPTCIHTQCTGIMAVLFNGIVMYGSHDCHMTLSHIAMCSPLHNVQA